MERLQELKTVIVYLESHATFASCEVEFELKALSIERAGVLSVPATE